MKTTETIRRLLVALPLLVIGVGMGQITPRPRVTALGPNRVRIEWRNEIEQPVTAWELQRLAPNGRQWMPLWNGPASIAETDDSWLPPGSDQAYRMRAHLASGRQAEWSLPALVTLPPAHSYLPTDDSFVVQGSPDSTPGTGPLLLVKNHGFRKSYLKFYTRDFMAPIRDAVLEMTLIQLDWDRRDRENGLTSSSTVFIRMRTQARTCWARIGGKATFPGTTRPPTTGAALI